MCESYSGPAKSGPIKRLTRLNSGPIKWSRLYTKYSGIRLLATRVLLIKWLLIREVANKGTELTQNLHLGPEDWLLIEQYC